MANDLQVWQTRFLEARVAQEKHHRVWKETQALVSGEWFKLHGYADPDATEVNYANAYDRTLVASVYARDPYLFVEAKHSRYTDFATSLERVVNYLWRELNLKRVMKRMVRGTGQNGISWCEVGYHATFESMDLTRAESPDDGFLTKMLNRVTGTQKRPEEQGVLNEYIKEQSAYAVFLSAWRILLAPGYHDISTMPYLFVAEDISPDDVKRHPYYAKQIDVDRVAPTHLVRARPQLITDPYPTKRPYGDSGLLMYRLWHIWDRRNQERRILVENSDTLIGPSPWPYSFEGFPQVPLIFNELAETDEDPKAYPQSDIEPMLPLLRELNQLRTAMVRHRKRGGTLIVTRKGALTEEQRTNLRTGEDVAIVEVDDPTGVVTFTPPNLPPDVYKVGERILADLDLVGGLSQMFLGGQNKGEKLATELVFQSQGVASRTTEKVDEVEDAAVQIARRLIAVAWEFYPREVIRQILGETQLTPAMWPEIPEDPFERREIIQRELGLSVEAGSTQPPRDKTLLRKQKLDAVSVFGNLFPERLNQANVAAWLLKDYDDARVHDIVNVNDDQERQYAEQENQLLLQGMPQAVGPNENHVLHLQIHGQAGRQAQGQPTDALDQHILLHSQMLQGKLPGQTAQQGDVRAQQAGGNMTQRRQGVPTMSDIQGPITRTLTRPGEERGGLPNAAGPT